MIKLPRTHPSQSHKVTASSSPPPANSFVIGPAVINTHTGPGPVDDSVTTNSTVTKSQSYTSQADTRPSPRSETRTTSRGPVTLRVGGHKVPVRVCRPFGARGRSSVRYGTRLGDLEENWFLLFSNQTLHGTHQLTQGDRASTHDEKWILFVNGRWAN
jgi:hypothetical protein